MLKILIWKVEVLSKQEEKSHFIWPSLLDCPASCTELQTFQGLAPEGHPVSLCIYFIIKLLTSQHSKLLFFQWGNKFENIKNISSQNSKNAEQRMWCGVCANSGFIYIFLVNIFYFFSFISCLSLKVVFHQRVSSIKGCLPSKVFFHQRLSSIKGCLPSKVIFHRSSSSIKGRLPSK